MWVMSIIDVFAAKYKGFKEQKSKRLNRQHLLNHGESKGVPEKHLLLLH